MNLKKIPFKKATAETSWEIVVLTSSIALSVIYICYIYLFIYIYIYIYIYINKGFLKLIGMKMNLYKPR